MCDLQLNTLKDPALTYNKMIFRLPPKCCAIKPVNIYSLQFEQNHALLYLLTIHGLRRFVEKKNSTKLDEDEN